MKRISTDDFSEHRMLPFAEALVAAAKSEKESEYAERLDAIQFPKRGWRWILSELLFRRWLGDRLAGFSVSVLLTSFLFCIHNSGFSDSAVQHTLGIDEVDPARR
jgi:hypothetical protein